jgi:hypothetical protein
LATDEDFPYTEYRDLDVLANDFNITTKIYHKAYQLFNQPHTKAATLQELRETFDDWYILPTDRDDTSQELDAAWLGNVFPHQPWHANWKWRVLDGVNPSVITRGEKDLLEENHVNYYSYLT